MNATPRAANSAIRISAQGRPQIVGYRCEACGAVASEQTICCRRCTVRAAPRPFTPGLDGRLYSWSVVERSYPGIKTPFVSAIVDLDEGLTLKGTLKDVAANDLRGGLPVRLVFDDAGGARNDNGEPYIGFHFQPRERVQA